MESSGEEKKTIFDVWSRANVYNIEKSSSKPKWFQIFAYPGPSGFLHVGTMRSYTYPDVIAKFKRLTGYNVYFPAGIHASGLPAVSFSERVNSGKYNEYLQDNNCSPATIKKFQTPEGVVDFFKHNYADIFKQMGFFINEETGIPTSIDPSYQKFIEWQFRTLFKKGFLIQKEYISSYCPNDGPVAIDTAETDLSTGGNAQIFEYTIIKFQITEKIDAIENIKEKIHVLTATLRPETMFGVTNIWIKPKTKYAVITDNEEYYIIADKSVPNISTIFKDFKHIGEIWSNQLINKKVINPITKEQVPIIPADFVKEGLGTGIVMSVPAHSPVDYLTYKISINNHFIISPPKVVVKSTFNGIPAEETVQKYGLKSISDGEKLESAITFVHVQEIEHGSINYDYKDYNNITTKDARKKIITELTTSNKGFIGHFFTESVICRCGTPVQIRSVPNQWFIRYSDSEINVLIKNHVRNKMKIFPSTYHEQMSNIIDWFVDRPCVRTGKWLGTPFPIESNDNTKLIIEPIADSTIYPAFYFISKYITTNKISEVSLTNEFFDFIFLNKGRIENVSKKTRISPSTLNEIQQDFQTWYPVNCNFGGKEHKTVHFPVFLKMHAMMFPKKYWPERIFVNWWVMQDTSQKKKIGKSKGGAGSVTQIINTYSADAIRLYYCHAASPYTDIEWSEIKIGQYQRDIDKIRNLVDVMTESFTNKHSTNISTDIETWLIYKLDEKFFEMFECLENYEIRKMTQECFYTIPKNIWRFIHRNGTFNEEIKNYIKTWIQYIAMITPFIAEKLYKKIGLTESVFSENSFIKKPIMIEKPSIVDEEEFIDEMIADIIKIKKVVKHVNTEKVYIFSNSRFFKSNKSESVVLKSSSEYIAIKTGSIPIINSENFSVQKEIFYNSNRPKLFFNRLQK